MLDIDSFEPIYPETGKVENNPYTELRIDIGPGSSHEFASDVEQACCVYCLLSKDVGTLYVRNRTLQCIRTNFVQVRVHKGDRISQYLHSTIVIVINFYIIYCQIYLL